MEALQAFFNNLVDAAWIIEIMLLSFTWVVLCGRAKKAFGWILHTVCLFFALAISNMILYLIFGEMNRFFIPLWGYIHGLISIIYLLIFSPFRKKTWVLLWIAMYNCCLAVMALSGQCSALFGEHVARGPMEGVIRCIIYLIMPITAMYLRRFKFDEFHSVPISGLVLVAIMCACTQILGWVESYYFTAGEALLVVLMTVYASLTLTAIACIRAIYTMCSEQRDLTNLQVERQRYLTEREMTKMAETSLEDLRCIRHDLKNQFSYLQILLSEKRYDEMEEYFAEMNDHIPPQLNLTDCGNKTMNTVLNMEFGKLRAKEIEFEHQLVIPPVLPFKDGDICAIISNLLDNAMDEILRLRDKGNNDTKVRIEIYPHQSYLYICCQNSTDRDSLEYLGAGLRSTKIDKQMHGYGTRIVAKLAEKYNGCADYRIKDGMFVAQVMLDIVGRNV